MASSSELSASATSSRIDWMIWNSNRMSSGMHTLPRTETELAMKTHRSQRQAATKHHLSAARLANAHSASRDFRRPDTEILELRGQLLDELNHRLKNNLQILFGLLQTAYRKTDNLEAREVLSDTSRRIGAMGTAQQVFYSVANSTDVSGQTFLEAICANARLFFSKEVSISHEATT